MSEDRDETAAAAADDGETKEECGWCKWMKAGGCGEAFEVWLKCVDDVREAGREDVETCSAVMGPLWDCMQKNADYYSPQVEAMHGRTAAEKQQQGGDGASASPSDKHSVRGGEGNSTSSAATAADIGAAIDVENITADDVERYLEALDQEEKKGKV